jgi:hypothetical protein
MVPIMLAALALAVFLGLGGRSVSGCGPTARPKHAAPAPSWHRACLPVPQRLAYQRLPVDDPGVGWEAGSRGDAVARPRLGRNPQAGRPRW